MKAIVAEIDKKQMIVVTDKGDFIKVKRQLSAGIGDEIELEPRKLYQTYRNLARVAACLLACIFLSTGVYAYYTPYSYVSVDINPSIALSLNRFERVISVKPLNEDAVNLLKSTKGLKNHDIDEALSELIKSASEKGYIDKKTENQVMVVVSAVNGKQENKLADSLTITAVNELSKVNNSYDVMVEKTSIESYRAALSNNMSPGKEILAGRLKELVPELKAEEIQNMSVKEVVHLINEGRKAIKAAEKAEKEKDKDKKKEEATLSDKNSSESDIKANVKTTGQGKDKKDKDKKDKDEKVKSDTAASEKNDDGEEVKVLGSETDDDKDKDKTDDDEDKDKDDKRGLEKESKQNDNKDINGKDNDKGNGKNGN